MGFRRFLAVLMVAPLAVALAVSCAPVQIIRDNEFAPSDNVDAPVANPGAYASSTGNGGDAGFDAGAPDGHAAMLGTTYRYLCGGSNPACWAGSSPDNCAPGGYPGLGGGPADASVVSCKLLDVDGGTTAQCGTWGVSGEEAPCTGASDCAAGLGCVYSLTSVCRAYCCNSPDSCPSGTYCAPSPMQEDQQLSIPVCTPASNCALFVDIPCSAGQTCEIVRDDGTTSCMTPGTSTDGQPCPCAKGFTCSWSTGTCLTLCHILGGTECGTKGYCQGGTEPYPAGIGICVWED
jgi:hypothetical protein